MDLGATIWSVSPPKCFLCPLAKNARRIGPGKEADYPIPAPRRPLRVQRLDFSAHRWSRSLSCCKKRAPERRLGSLWSHPSILIQNPRGRFSLNPSVFQPQQKRKNSLGRNSGTRSVTTNWKSSPLRLLARVLPRRGTRPELPMASPRRTSRFWGSRQLPLNCCEIDSDTS
ncbi:MAG: hypothetical protein CM1200mP9_05420 [Gammaproteobacteria bacterium]|nr:MAG: hypothetical protein CM1200mP9_05420 [Gammaproteobacteria bacterium]